MGELFDTFQKNLQDTIQKELLDTNDTIDTNVGVKKVNISGDQKSKSLAPIVNTKREPINNNKRTFKKSVDQKRRILRPIVNTKRKFSNRIVDQKRRVLGPIIRPLIDLKQKKLGYLKSILI